MNFRKNQSRLWFAPSAPGARGLLSVSEDVKNGATLQLLYLRDCPPISDPDFRDEFRRRLAAAPGTDVMAERMAVLPPSRTAP